MHEETRQESKPTILADFNSSMLRLFLCIRLSRAVHALRNEGRMKCAYLQKVAPPTEMQECATCF